MFPTFADVADFVQLFARLPGTAGREGVTCFLIDTGTPGYRIARSIATIGGEPSRASWCSKIAGCTNRKWSAKSATAGRSIRHGSAPGAFKSVSAPMASAQRVLRVVRELVRHEAKRRRGNRRQGRPFSR